MRKFLLCAILALFSATVSAQTIRIVVPYAAGGFNDGLARFIQQTLSSELNRQVVVEYRAGAGGDVGTAYVGNAPAGETYLLLHGVGLSVSQNLRRPLYPENNLAPLVIMGTTPLVLLVPGNSQLNTLKAWFQANDSRGITYGTSGIASTSHVISAMFQTAVNKNMIHVPYKGQSQLLPDLLAGVIDSAIMYPSVALPHVESHSLKAVAVINPRRIPMLPKTPTFLELGYKNMDLDNWYAVIANANAVPEDLAVIQNILIKTINNPSRGKELSDLGLDASARMAPRDFLRNEKQLWGNLLNKYNIKLE
jgi:tripartite-type tricarboxylate transporter receptor subunit TctC